MYIEQIVSSSVYTLSKIKDFPLPPTGIDPTTKPTNGETGGGGNIDALGDLFGATPATAASTTSKDDVRLSTILVFFPF